MSHSKEKSETEFEPVKIIKINLEPSFENSKYVLLPNELTKLLEPIKNTEVCVIGIIGTARRGKSFLLNYMLRYLTDPKNSQWMGDDRQPLEGFQWLSSGDPQTFGIWFSKPFILKQSNGKEIAVILMDTQGLFDDTYQPRDWSTIVGISLMVSSFLIVNLFTDISEDMLSFFNTYIDYGIEAKESIKSKDSEDNCPFQNLLFLIRDWNTPNDFGFGITGGEKYLNKKLIVRDHQSPESQKVRKNIKNCFQSIKCFLMPQINADIMENKDFNGSVGQLRETFRVKMEELITRILNPEELVPKMIFGTPITGEELGHQIQSVVEVFNKKELPDSHNILEANTKLSDNILIRKLRDLHLEQIQRFIESKSFINRKQLEEQNRIYKTNCIEDFESSMNSRNSELTDKLIDLLNVNYQIVYKENENRRDNWSKQAVEVCSQAFMEVISSVHKDNKFVQPETLENLFTIHSKKFIEKFRAGFEGEDEKLFESQLFELTKFMNNYQETEKNIEKIKQKYLESVGLLLDGILFEQELKDKHFQLTNELMKNFNENVKLYDEIQIFSHKKILENFFSNELLSETLKLKQKIEILETFKENADRLIEDYLKNLEKMAESDNLHDENDFKNVHLISRDKVINSLENYLELNPCSAANEDFMRIKQILSGIYNKYLQIFKSNQKNKRSQFEIRISKLSEDYNKRMNDNFIKFENQSQLDNFHDKTKRQIKKNFIDECESEPCEELDAFLIKLSKLIDDDKRDFEILFRIDIENKREMHKRIKSDIRQFYNDEMDKFIKNEYFIGIKEFFQNHKTVFKNTIDKYQEKLNLSGKNISEFVKEAISDIFIKIQEENILKQPQESPAIGIDLGTTNSCVTYFDSNIRSDNVLVIPNEFGNKTTPSIVSFRDKNIIITGDAAKDDIHQYSENTVKSAKRLIGREFGDLSVQSHIKTCSYKVIENQNHNPMISVKVDGKEHNFKPEEISSHILGQMKKIAENHLGRAVNKAVITVPAYFNDSQRKSTIEAGKLAGLEVLRIIDEPTAAAIAFRMDRTIKETRTILVFDFGGGTLDVSILKITKGVIEVIAKGGDNILGGDDFDSNLSEYCLKEFKNQYKIEIKGTELPAAISRLRTECEKHKKRLSFCESTTLSISYFYKKYDLKVLLTRDKFEEINYHLFIKSMNLVTTTLEDKQIPTSDIDDIVLVGGSTRIPKIRELLSQIFGGRPLDHSVNPDEAVAKGAGIQAALLNGSQSYGLEELELREKTSHSLGIKADIGVVQHKLSIMIPRYTNIPTEITGMYYTTQDTQTTALIEIYEGEKEMAKDNHLLGKFYMKNIPVVKGTKQSIAVTFRIDKEGLLKVKAKLVTTGEENEIEITEKRFGWDGPGNE